MLPKADPNPLRWDFLCKDGYRSWARPNASIASTVLTTEAVVSDKKEPQAPVAGAPGGMDGMY